MSWKALPVASLLLYAWGVNAGFQDDYGRIPPPTTTQAVLEERQFTNYPVACTEWSSAISFCKSASPGFVSMDLTSQAPCLCYSSTFWIPSTFDVWAQQCANWAFTADPTDYSVVAGWEGLCTSAGNVLAEPGVSSPTPTSSLRLTVQPTTPPVSTNVYTNPGCSFVSFALSFCNSVSPGFSTLPSSSQAPCLCYSSTSWSPDGFDGPVLTCANYVKTADPYYYSNIADLEGFCSSVGPLTTETGGKGIPLTNPEPSPTPTGPASTTEPPVSTTTTPPDGGGVVTISTSSKGGAMPTGVAFPGWVQAAVVVELVVAVML